MNETMIPENLQNSTTNVIQRLLLALKQREEDNSISSFVKIKKKKEQKGRYQWGNSSGSRQLRLTESKSFPSPQVSKRGLPSTQVINLPQSPGTGNLKIKYSKNTEY